MSCDGSNCKNCISEREKIQKQAKTQLDNEARKKANTLLSEARRLSTLHEVSEAEGEQMAILESEITVAMEEGEGEPINPKLTDAENKKISQILNGDLETNFKQIDKMRQRT